MLAQDPVLAQPFHQVLRLPCERITVPCQRIPRLSSRPAHPVIDDIRLPGLEQNPGPHRFGGERRAETTIKHSKCQLWTLPNDTQPDIPRVPARTHRTWVLNQRRLGETTGTPPRWKQTKPRLIRSPWPSVRTQAPTSLPVTWPSF